MDAATTLLDRRGKTITTLLAYDVAVEFEKMDHGETVELLTDDFAPIESDITAWCNVTGHELVANDRTAEGRRFLIAKKGQPSTRGALAMVISSNGLEELLSPLGFALAAALEGMQVHVFVQGPAVRVLKRGFRPKLSGWSRPFSRLAASGMAKTGHVPALEKLGQLRHLGAKIYLCAPSMQHFRVKPEDLVFDDLPQVEYLSFMAVMAGTDVQIYS